MTPRLTVRKRSVVLGALVTAAATLTVSTVGGGAAGAAAPTARPYFGGDAFGSLIQLGSLVNSGKTANVPVCSRDLGINKKKDTAALDLPGVGKVGIVKNHVTTRRLDGGVRVLSVSHTAKTTLLGVIQLRALSTQASATRKDGKTTLDGGSTFVGLSIAGQKVPANVPANTKYALPGLGSVVLNQQTRSTKFGNPQITVSSLVITIGSKAIGLPTGQIVVGRSSASLHDPTYRGLKGSAYATKVSVGGVIKSSPTAPVYTPCGGTSGQTDTQNATVHEVLPGVVSTGDVTSSTHTTDNAKRSSVLATDRVAGISLFGGVIQAKAITAHAYAERAGGKLSRSSTGTTIGSLTINGEKQTLKQKPNTKYSVLGLGTLWVHRVVKSRDGLSVYALRLVLGQAQGDLPAGAVIDIGAAHAEVLKS